MASQNHSAESISKFLKLPNDILQSITRLLNNGNIKNLRLVCKHLRDVSRLRFDRIFISANQRNIEVFRAVATHEEFRKQVVEIIWDDARLEGFSPEDSDGNGGEEDEEEECPRWFAEACQENVDEMDDHDRESHEEQLASLMPSKDSYAYYMDLCKQQQAVLKTEEDAEALRLGLRSFPALRRVTICPVTHRQFLSPRYLTPMIRSFPPGFNYPIPKGWPTTVDLPAIANEWVSNEEKMKWRGFCIVTRELSNHTGHQITEFVVDVNRAWTGLNCHIFDAPSKIYEDLRNLFNRQGFKRIDLALNVGDIYQTGWGPFHSGLITKALASSHDLEHFYFHTNTVLMGYQKPPYDPRLDIGMSLLEIFPIAQWPKLKSFGLSNYHVKINDLITFLSQLPPSIQTLELTSIEFLDSDWQTALPRMRDELSWQSWLTPPKLTVSIPSNMGISGLATWLSNEIDAFLYGEGSNPFSGPNYIPIGTGMVKQDFDESSERPNLDTFALMDLGFLREQRPWKLNREEHEGAQGFSWRRQ